MTADDATLRVDVRYVITRTRERRTRDLRARRSGAMIYALLRTEPARRRDGRTRPLNGIDFLEVLDRDAPAGSPRQRTLLVHC